MTTEILTSPDVDQDSQSIVVEDIDASREDDNLRHIVRPMDNPGIANPLSDTYVQDIVDIAMVKGLELVALCGKKWVPSRSTENRKTCNPCIEIAGRIKGNNS